MLRGEPAIFNCFGKVFDEVARDIQNLELGKATNGVGKVPKLVGVHVQNHHVQQSRC